MNRTHFRLTPVLFGALGLLGFFARCDVADAADASKPNIVFILADDLGWKDLGCYGTYSYQTPNIDQLAKEGMLFTNYHAYPTCSPSRAGIITGMDPARLGITTPSCHDPRVLLKATLPKVAATWMRERQPSFVTRLDTKYLTFANVLKDAGYTTGHFGKWHLGLEPYSPLQHGFDVDVPHFPGPGPSGSFIAPWNPQIEKFFNPPPKPGDNLEDRMAQEASAFIDKNKDHPFLLDYWAFSVHEPLNAKDSYIDQYRDIAKSNHPQRNPVYAAMVKTLDDAVGTLMATLKKDGLEQNTIVIFSSDNGGLEYWGNGQMAHKEYQDTPATSNDPLRGGKGMIFDGGIRVPLIVKWPGVVKPGTTTGALDECMDIYPTVIEMAGLQVPTTQPLDGYSFVPVLQGTKPWVRREAFCLQPHDLRNYLPIMQGPSATVLNGDWKLIHFYGANPDGSDRLELYNLKDNLEESFDLSHAVPAITAELSKDLDAYLAKIGAVLPAPNPAYDPKAPLPTSKAQAAMPYEPLIEGD
jgi:arylsulfatase A-like enzyme